MTSAIGGALVDLEQAILRARPTVEERYERRDEVTLAATDGGELVIEMPPEARVVVPDTLKGPEPEK
ncbi:MAG TPA: hypothetical protein VK871_07840 [Candidatus Limnocylindrales bacterium]|nr:hypothetical protein [Candidatus Limnocylindrales bacterium]